ncbi:MAG: hypothetical protein IT428_32635 [Planctomycetaceae bacterium]|nr:hypothetical protein [Planctomycetaceae bacterium]
MFLEVIIHEYFLRRWKADPTASKRSYSVISKWQTPNASNDFPPTMDEVNRWKAWYKKHVEPDYYKLFPEEQNFGDEC